MRKKTKAEKITLPGNAIESPGAYFWTNPDGVIVILNKPNTFHGLGEARNNIATVMSIAGGAPRLLLIDITNIKALSREAREEYANAADTNGVKAVAIVTDSGIGKIIGNFFISYNKPKVPTRLFSSHIAAKEWLSEFA